MGGIEELGVGFGDVEGENAYLDSSLHHSTTASHGLSPQAMYISSSGVLHGFSKL